MKFSCPVIYKNEGTVDRIIRLVSGALLIILSSLFLDQTFQIIGMLVGIVLITTGAVGYCGLYSLLHITTISKKDKKHEQ